MQRILAIETSCDETAIAIIEVETDGSVSVLANETLSQIDLHREYGGVFPALAKREHAKALPPLLLQALEIAEVKDEQRARHEGDVERSLAFLSREGDMQKAFTELIIPLDIPKVDVIAVTEGPGLEPALWVGINFAEALGALWRIPVMPINHMEGHIVAAVCEINSEEDRAKGHIRPIGYPAVALLISGGHTELVRMDAFGKYSLIGETRDDAVGECFDKVARMLGLPYPGGPEISKFALLGSSGTYDLPRPMLHTQDCDFSFSGLKTAVLYLVKDLGVLTEQMKYDIARAFEDAVTEVIVKKTKRALEESGARSLVVGGGVSANKRLRTALAELSKDLGIGFFLPTTALSTDNALMIALAASMHERAIPRPLKARGNWKIHELVSPR